MSQAQHRIVITPEPFGAGYDIKIEPCVTWAHNDVERPTLHEAMRYARSLKTLHGWPINDRSGSDQ
jgi:hypothetical protein